MKPLQASPFILSAAIAALLAVPSFAGGIASPTDEPVIAAISGRKVRVKVPAGFKDVTLQRKTAQRKTPWVTLSKAAVNNEEKEVVFTLRKRISKRYLRVFGQQEGKLPGSFYTGTTNFLGEQVVSQPGSNLSFGSTSSGTLTLSGGAVSNASSDSSVSSNRTVTESDIWKLDGDRLYFFNQYRGLQNIDVSDTAKPALLGTLRMPAAGEDLYQLDSTHVAILKRTPKELGWTSGSPTFDQANQSGEVVVCDVSTPEPTIVARVPFEGWIANSRLIGSALVIAKNVPRQDSGNWGWSTNVEVTGYDLSVPSAPVERNTVKFSNSGGSWVSAVQASNRCFMVAQPNYDYSGAGGGYNTVINLVDVSNPDGTLIKGGTASVKGYIPDKFKLRENGGVMSAVSAVSGIDPQTGNWTSSSELQNFDVSDLAHPAKLGAITVGRNESTRAVRFDGDRVYIVTVVQQDPLWIVDNTDPLRPTLSGELHVPGFSSYIEPLGDRLVTVGRIWGDDGTGNWQNRVSVSLYDVADATKPVQLSQLPVGTGWSSSEAEWDDKAFTVLPDAGLIMLPYSSGWWFWGGGNNGGVQLIDLKRDSLALRGVIQHGFTPRRTAIKDDTVLALSASDLLTVDISDRDTPVVKADVELAWNVSRVWIVGKQLLQLGQHLNDRSPVLSVSPLDNPDDTTSTLDIGNGPVQSAELKGDLLYVVQQPDPSVASATGDATLVIQHGKLTVFSIASLPQIVKLSEASIPNEDLYGVTSLLFPTDATAVVARKSSYYPWYRPFPMLFSGDLVVAQPGAVTVAAETLGLTTTTPVRTDLVRATAASNEGVSLNVAMPIWGGGWGYSSGTMELFAFDVANPRDVKYLATTKLEFKGATTFSEAFADTGKIFASHFTGGYGRYYPVLLAEDTNDNTAVEPIKTNRHFLSVVDYSVPATPVVSEPVSVPGELRGVTRKGELLYLLGPGYDATGRADGSKQFIHAAAFDGVAHLVDSIDLGKRWYGGNFEIGNGNVFVSRNDYDSDTQKTTTAFEAWTLNDEGKFILRDTLPLPFYYDWSLVGDLAISPSGGGTFSVVNVANLSELKLIGYYGNPNSYFWYSNLGNCSKVVGNLSLGFWIPEGDYGVKTVPPPPQN